MSLLDDENILMENAKNTISLEVIKTLWKDGDLKDVEDMLNEKYIHKECFSWRQLIRNQTIVCQGKLDYCSNSLLLCEFEMDIESRLVLAFDLINLHIYFKYKEKEEKFIQDVLSLFGVV